MIYYDSHHQWTLLKYKGSILPKATTPSLISALLSFALKMLENHGYFGDEGIAGARWFSNSAVYSGFTFTLGFIIVFRSSQSYNRFWSSACAVHTMREQWHQAASNLCNFVMMSDRPVTEQKFFKHKIVRLFSMLHAMALAKIATMDDENFPIIDIRSWHPSVIRNLQAREDAQRVEVIFQWISSLVVRSIKSELLNIPPPILTRVFQELEDGMVQFAFILQIMKIPFPFPYAQTTFVLIQIYAIITPFVMCVWTTAPWCAALFSFISILGIRSVNMTATELEDPFGDDANDLPVHLIQEEFNQMLILLLDPAIHVEPKLDEHKVMSYHYKDMLNDLNTFLSFDQAYDRKSYMNKDPGCFPGSPRLEEKDIDTIQQPEQLEITPSPPRSTAVGQAPEQIAQAPELHAKMLHQIVQTILSELQEEDRKASQHPWQLGDDSMRDTNRSAFTPKKTATFDEMLALTESSQSRLIERIDVAQANFLGKLEAVLQKQEYVPRRSTSGLPPCRPFTTCRGTQRSSPEEAIASAFSVDARAR